MPNRPEGHQDARSAAVDESGRQPSAGAFLRSTLVVAAPTIGAAMITFLVGTLAVRLRRDLGFDEAGLGLAVGSSRAAAAVAAVAMGRMAERMGPAAGLRIGTLAAAATMIGIATLVDTWVALVGFLMFGGVVATLTLSCGDLWLSRAVPLERQGLAFGIRQAAGPLAAMLAGLAVPTLAHTLGWRWTFGVVGGLAGLAGLAVPRGFGGRRRAPRRVDRTGDVPLGPMAVMAVAHGLGNAGAHSLTAFLVIAAVEVGLTESAAGLLFSLGAALAIVSGLLLGHLADRHSRSQLRVVSGLLGCGAVTYLLLATGNPTALVVAAPMAFTTAWGWRGLFTLSMVWANPVAPAAGAAITRTGGAIGGILGPLVFGVLAQRSYTLAWTAASAWTLLAAVVVVVGRRLVIRTQHSGRPA